MGSLLNIGILINSWKQAVKGSDYLTFPEFTRAKHQLAKPGKTFNDQLAEPESNCGSLHQSR